MSSKTGWQRVARRIRVPMGFVFAAVFLKLATPEPRSMVASVALVAAGLCLRGYAAGYVKKNAELTTTGPYAYTRNPLYLGSMLIAAGFALASARWEIFVALTVLFAAIYIPTIQSEEAWLREHFAEFDAYARCVPRLLPRLTKGSDPSAESGAFSWDLYRKHREYNALIGASAIYLALVLKYVLKFAVFQR